jgi:hypothetical protein
MNGGNPGASQWFQLELHVYADGTMTIKQTLTNDTLDGWCGSYRIELHDLRDNALLFAANSAEYCIGGKSFDTRFLERRGEAGVWVLNMDPSTARRFMAHPSVYGVRSAYRSIPFGSGVFQVLGTVGRVVFGSGE